MKKLNKKGFTIVELVIVIAVIAILAGVLIPTFATVVDKANKSAAMQQAKNAYENYLVDHAEEGTDKINLCIEAGGYAFYVENGQFKSEAQTTHKSDNGYTHVKVTDKAETFATNGSGLDTATGTLKTK